MKYYKAENGKKVLITDRDRWKIARPFLVELVLMMTNFIFEKDEKFKKD